MFPYGRRWVTPWRRTRTGRLRMWPSTPPWAPAAAAASSGGSAASGPAGPCGVQPCGRKGECRADGSFIRSQGKSLPTGVKQIANHSSEPEFEVTLSTIQRDLALLSAQGRIARAYGGVMALGARSEASLRRRPCRFRQKHAIVCWAASVISAPRTACSAAAPPRLTGARSGDSGSRPWPRGGSTRCGRWPIRGALRWTALAAFFVASRRVLWGRWPRRPWSR